MKVAIYARGREACRVERQLQTLRTHAQHKKWTIVQEYVDRTDGNDGLKRPGLDALRLAAAKEPRPFQGVAVTGIDRFSRSFLDLRKVVSEFEGYGIAILTPREATGDLPKLFRVLSVK